MNEFVFNLPEDYGWVLLCSCVMGLSIILMGFIFASGARSKVFTEEYMKNNFGEEHRALTGEEITKGGYPDTGSGYYSSKLNYQQWLTMNNGQRAHLNFVEWIASCEVFLLVGGLYFPIPAAAVGLGVVIFRFIYGIGYVKNGANGRLIGAIGADLLFLAQFVLAVISSIYFIVGNQ